MSRIDELLKNAQVEWKKLGEVCDLQRGRVISKKYLEQHIGQYPVYSSQTRNNGEIGKIDSYDFDGEYTTWTTDGAYAGTIFYRNGKFSITNICGLISPKDKQQLIVKFIFYWLEIEAKKHVRDGAGNPKLMSNVVADITIPIPSLELQAEIVRILDAFAQLTAELTAELTAREKQYRYYLEKLMSEEYLRECNEKMRDERELVVCKLKEVFDSRNGYTPSKAKQEYWQDGKIPWFRMEDIRTNGNILSDSIQHVTDVAVKGELFKEDSIILATSATIGEHALIKVPFLANQRFTCFSLKEEFRRIVNIKYVYYYFYLLDEWCKKNINVSNFASVDMDNLMLQSIPLPPLSLQEKIVKVLDKFESLTKDASGLLPKEIEARQKQYEYYREKLLTFNQKTNTIFDNRQQTTDNRQQTTDN